MRQLALAARLYVSDSRGKEADTLAALERKFGSYLSRSSRTSLFHCPLVGLLGYGGQTKTGLARHTNGLPLETKGPVKAIGGQPNRQIEQNRNGPANQFTLARRAAVEMNLEARRNYVSFRILLAVLG
ncbi:hypothetical protein BDK51DRAFT_43505 [Blyttiomyces helicus]|uniref:Uncharacterized protein n=1 Tax=Blyttiomyces helicus TaxID=388810 RepID=A0A4P9WBU6_9FUNG|nr:hypothetical protein BDK51DRAFT_43505 [Blyttiomyces helicus]|eukprot:RKO90099.1 hypothetical protein BDK51DRAFT_43505 [Blyttiomyces helicus]